MLKLSRLLDPRDNPTAPICDSVNIPVAELADRVFELPSRSSDLAVANTGPEAQIAVAWLIESGRDARLTNEFEIGGSDLLRLWRPNAFLEEIISDIPVGHAIDLACGTGRDAVFLASAGFKVTAVDVLPDAIALGKNLEARYPLPVPIDWLAMDLESTLPDVKVDLAVCFFYLDREMLSSLASKMQSGSHIVLETFNAEHRAKFGKPKREKLVLEHEELPQLLPEFEVLRCDEGLHGDRYTTRFWARLP